MRQRIRVFSLLLIILFSIEACAPAATPTPPESFVTSVPSPIASQTATPAESFTITLLYPTASTEIHMGQSIKVIVQVVGKDSSFIQDADVKVTVSDPSGKQVADLPAQFGSGNAYRTDSWTVPHHEQAGDWQVSVTARSGSSIGVGSGMIKILNSTSETLLEKYGFWLDAPTLRGIVPSLFGEEGDAQNGMILWGGTIGSQHIIPANWIEVDWRTGDFHLDNPDVPRQFMLEQIGEFGITLTREIGPFEPFQFKNWNGWKAKVRGQVKQDQIELVVFYAPEVNKTYAIFTDVVQPPNGIDAHSTLRNSFTLYPELNASGVAPVPLPHLLPGPVLVSPPLGEQFIGLDQPIVLTWKPVKELAPDEYYEVHVDYNHVETNTTATFTTRDTQFTLPVDLYREPNCQVFNWQVTLKKQTGMDKQNQPVGESLSFPSLYWYVRWTYPLGQEPDNKPSCPNPQY